MNLDKDVILLQTGGEATRLTALVNGSIDATVLNPPVYKKAVEAGMRALANIQEMEIPFQNFPLVSTQRFVAKNPRRHAPFDEIVRRRNPFDQGPIRTAPSARTANTCTSRMKRNTDYPHPDAIEPKRALPDLDAQPIPDDARRKILWDNAVKLFGSRILS